MWFSSFLSPKKIRICTLGSLPRRWASISVGSDSPTLLTSGFKINFENPESPVPWKLLNRLEAKNYKYPLIKFHYSKGDVVQHALSLGIKPGTRISDQFLNPNSENFSVLPSFIFPLNNKLLLDLSEGAKSWMTYHKTVHGEHFVEYSKPLPPQGTLCVHFRTIDVLDKGTNAVYCHEIRGEDESGDLVFLSEYQMYELGTGGFKGPRNNPDLKASLPILESDVPDPSTSDLTFETIGVDREYAPKLSPQELELSLYHFTHPRQYYAITNEFSSQIIFHGRYYFAKTLLNLLIHYAEGNVGRFKAAQVRFTRPVHPGEKVNIRTWTSDNKNLIKFEGFVGNDRVMGRGYILLSA